jgi:beta-lactamase superfamily II metal-dependent hydrolase
MKIRKILLGFYWILSFQSPFVLASGDPTVVEIHGINVGYGDAILLRFDTRMAILIDGGSGQQGLEVVNYLKSKGIKELDIVICTHSHPDHAEGLRSVLEIFKVKEIWTNGEKIDWLYRLASLRSIAIVPLIKKVINLDHGIKVRVLNAWKEGRDPNEGSLAFILDFGKSRLFFSGDISPNIQKELLDSAESLSADFLKIPHHGWGVLPEFVQAVNPKRALISVGSNPYGAPEAQTIRVLSQLGSKVYRTDKNGSVVIKMGENETAE